MDHQVKQLLYFGLKTQGLFLRFNRHLFVSPAANLGGGRGNKGLFQNRAEPWMAEPSVHGRIHSVFWKSPLFPRRLAFSFVLQQKWGHAGAFQAPTCEPDQSSSRKCALAVEIGLERDFCQAVIITFATRLPCRVSWHSA